MIRKLTTVAAALLPLLAAGCTVFPDTQPAPLNLTTSAERSNQIFWDDVAAAKWSEVSALLSGTATWQTGAAPLADRQAILTLLQSSGIHSAQVSNAQVHANGDTLVVAFDLQTNLGSHPMLSVWQRLPGKKAPAPYLLIAMAQLG